MTAEIQLLKRALDALREAHAAPALCDDIETRLCFHARVSDAVTRGLGNLGTPLPEYDERQIRRFDSRGKEIKETVTLDDLLGALK